MKPSTTIKLAIADDQSIFRKGLISSLDSYPNLQVTIEAENGKTLLAQLAHKTADVVLLDMKMPEMNGVDVCRNIKKSHTNIKVIGLSAYDHHYYVSNFFNAGGDGYILKDVGIGEIVYAINSVHQNGSFLNEGSTTPILKRLMDMEQPGFDYSSTLSVPLKSYEVEILKLVALEYTTAEIASKMKLSPKTIENYRGILLEKIGAKNIAGLVTYAVRKGLIEL